MTGLGTPRDVAAYLDVTTNRLNKLRYEGTGPTFVKIGRTVRYRWSDVDAWVTANEHTMSAGSAQ